jgi:hypothetical protein
MNWARMSLVHAASDDVVLGNLFFVLISLPIRHVWMGGMN